MKQNPKTLRMVPSYANTDLKRQLNPSEWQLEENLLSERQRSLLFAQHSNSQYNRETPAAETHGTATAEQTLGAATVEHLAHGKVNLSKLLLKNLQKIQS